MSPQSGALQAGIEALKQGRYSEAINLLETFCRNSSFSDAKEGLQAQMGLVKAYQRTGQIDKAIALCQQLIRNDNPQVKTWAEQALAALRRSTETRSPAPRSASAPDPAPATPGAIRKLGRAAQTGVKLSMTGIGGSLALASGVTMSLLFGMVFVLVLSMVLIVNSDQPFLGLGIAVGITLVFNLLAFFISPWFMDLIQGWFYGTRWVSLSDVARHSPESARIIQQVCAQKKIQQPRLGIIADENPTAFTYGSLPNSARLVVSQGLFTYLDDDEVATVYAHELGHIVHWDFAVMTIASTLVQITYLIYSTARRLSRGGDGKLENAAGTAAIAAYIFYVIGTYLVLYLSRTREYFADHFAAETTGNPNGLSRALVKIAYGIVEESQKSPEPSKLIEGTRALGIYDPKAATSTGTAYRVAPPEKMGRVFLWDMFNPWGWWMELSSTHPLTGKRVRALSTYAEQLGLDMEFDMGRVVAESRTLNKKKLYGNFALDLVLYSAEFIGLAIGLLIGAALVSLAGWKVLISLGLIGLGLGILIKMVVMFPDFSRAPASDVLTLMSDPYASPLRGQPVKLTGDLIGRGDAGNKVGSDLKLQDKTGLMYVHYASRFGPFGNLMFGATQVKDLVGENVNATGWFRRSLMPWVDLINLKTVSGKTVNSYHRFWKCVIGVGIILLAFVVPVVF